MFKGKKLQIGLGAGSLLVVAVLALVPISYQALRQQQAQQGSTTKAKFALPSGPQTYSIAQAAEVWPKIEQATINPPDVHVGDTQTIEAVIESRVPLTDVSADIETDHGTVHLKLNFVGLAEGNSPDPFAGIITGHNTSALQHAEAEETTKGRYSGQWVVKDTHDTKYHTTINATAGSDHSSVVLAWSDACGIPLGGDADISTPCTISSIDGVDAGNLTIEATLTLNADFAYNGGKSLTLVSGKPSSIALCNGCNIKQTNIWMTDADGDGYPGDSGAIFHSNTVPQGSNARRRSVMTSATPDCDDSVYSASNTCAATTQVVYYTFDDDSGNTVMDYSGYENTGYLDASPKIWPIGYGDVGNSEDVLNRTITIADAASLRLTGDKSFNFLWQNANDGNNFSSDGDFISKGTDNEFHIQLEPGSRISSYGGDSSGWAVLAESGHGPGTWWPWMREGVTLTAADGQWHMVTLTLSGSTGKLYQDGVLLQTITTGGTTSSSGNDVTIGNLQAIMSEGVVLDEFSIYNGALSDSDVSTLASGYGCGYPDGCFARGGGFGGGGPLSP